MIFEKPALQRAMKCIAYVSDIVGDADSGGVPPELTAILQRSRLNNRNHNITGLLTYRRGQYFQIIEGAIDDVNTLFETIQKDIRHRNVQKIVNLPISKLSFPDWSMKVSATLDKESSMLEFAYRHRMVLNQLPNDKLRLLRGFFNHPILVSNAAARAPYDGLQLNINAWPNFAQITPTDLLMDVCAELLQGPLTFEQLVANCPDFSEQKVFEATQQLDELGLLAKTIRMVDTSRVTTRKQTTLYSKLKSFLTWS